MARTEKKTQIKGVPGVLRLNVIDSLQGAYPAVNDPYLSGNIQFQDRNTISFTSSTIYFGLNLPTGSAYVATLPYLTTSMTGSGRVSAGISDAFIQFSASIPFAPFRDNNQYAADGKSQGNRFYATGANLSNFSSPLWSKEKLEINLSTATAITIGDELGPTKTRCHNMVYYNHSSATWMPVGTQNVATYYISQALSSPPTGVAPWYREKAIGFGAISGVPNISYENATVLDSVRTFSEFGFPFDQKYFVSASGPSSSILYPLSGVLRRPFLLEGIAVDFTGSHNSGDLVSSWGGGATGFAASFFFVLNQRKGIPVNQIVLLEPGPSSFPTNLTGSYTATHNAGIMDLVTALPIFTPGKSSTNWVMGVTASEQRESVLDPNLRRNPNLNFIFPSGSDSDINALKWSGRFIISGVCCAPVSRDKTDRVYNPLAIRSGTTSQINYINPTYKPSRNGTSNVLSNRNFVNTVLGYQRARIYDPFNDSSENLNSVCWTANPYVLMPDDQLIFGWQSPHMGDVFETMIPDGIFYTGSGDFGPQLTIAAGRATVVLYGSYISDDHEAVMTNQVLSSNSVHEALE